VSRAAVLPALRRHAHVLLPLVGVLVLASPLLLTGRAFGSDWPNHLWLVWQQGLAIDELGHPTRYLQTDLGAFFPWFAFYGGSLYAALGFLGSLGGEHPLAAYVLGYVAAFASAWLGWSWLARQAGLRGLATHLPGFVFVTSAYYVTNSYGRGDLPEVVATSALPLLAAAGLHLLRARRWGFWPVLAFVAATIAFTGSHTISVVYGSTFLALVAVVVLVAAPGALRPPLRRLVQVVGLGALGSAVNLWFLLPLVSYSSRVRIGDPPESMEQEWFSEPSAVLSLVRDVAPVGPADEAAIVNTQAPVLFGVWAVIVLLLTLSRLKRPERRLAAGLGAILVLFLALMFVPAIIEALPKYWRFIQFPYRVGTYVTLATAGLVLVALLGLRHSTATLRRGAAIALAALCALAAFQAIDQAWSTPSSLPDRSEVFADREEPPKSWYAPRDYADISLPVVAPTLPGILEVPNTGRRLDMYELGFDVPAAGTQATDILTAPYLVEVEGATVAGRTGDNELVVAFDRPGPRLLRFRGASSGPVVAGTALSVLALAGIAALLLVIAVRQPRLAPARARVAASPPALRLGRQLTGVRSGLRDRDPGGWGTSVREGWSVFWWSRLLVFVVAVWITASDVPPIVQPADVPLLTRPFEGWFGGDLLELVFGSLARWDAVHYLAVAFDGYAASDLPLDPPEQRSAFFPLYPMAVRVLSGFGASAGAVLLASYAVSLACFAGALVLLHRLVTLELGERYARPTLLLLAFAPTALFFGLPYTEALFLLLAVGAFLAARSGRWAVAGLVLALASATRVPGLLLVVPVALIYLYGPRADRDPAAGPAGAGWRRLLPRYRLRPDVLWLALAPLGIVAFSLYLAQALGDATAWQDAQRAFGRASMLPLEGLWNGARYAAIGVYDLATGREEGPMLFDALNIAQFAILVLAAVAGWRMLRLLPVAYGAWVLVSLLPSLASQPPDLPLMSLPRYVVVLFPIFMWLAVVCERRQITTKAVAVSAAFMALLTVQYVLWSFVG
jgi:hypothetical protein